MASNRRYLGSGRVWVSLALLVVVLAGCSIFYEWWRRSQSAPAVQASTSPSTTSEPAAEPPSEPVAEAPRASAQPVSAQHDEGKPDIEVGPGARVVLSFSAHEKTWVSIFSDGKRIFSGVLEPSQSKTLGGKDAFRIRVGNAAGIEITWNGKAIGPIGPRGQVRDVVFTPDNYQILSPSGSL